MTKLRSINWQFLRKGDRFWMTIILGLLLSSCAQNKLSQCEQIFRIAQGVNQSSKNIADTKDEESTELKSWLEVASTMNIAASKIEALHINDSNLIPYQNKLATIYRIYAQATYNAVEARENQNLKALQTARNEAQKAGKMQQEAVQYLNSYCLNES